MGLRAFSRLGFFLLSLACGLSATRCLYADEAPVTSWDQKEEAFGSAADQGRLAWAILEAIEQHNISPPPRKDLIRAITRGLFRVPKDAAKDFPYRKLLERVDAEFLECQNADEMAHAVERNERFNLDFDRVVADLRSGFGENLGEFRLIRSKDHDVEEQFHGNRYVGLGINVFPNDPSHLPVIMKIRPGGPADSGGLKPKTYIHEIDGRPTENVPQGKILDWIRGPIGTDVTLKVSTEMSKEQRLVTLTRGLVRVESLKDRNREPISRDGLRYDRREPIGWISVETINGSTLHELRVVENQAREDGIQVLVLDFRGFGQPDDFHQSLLVADSFLDGSPIWTRTEASTEPRVEYADRDCLFRDILLVVVVDRTTRPSLSAIAAALQDAGRATLVGESPYFMGVISSTVRLNGVPFSLAMATARLDRARRDRQWPLEPDYSVVENMAASANQPPIPKGFRIGDRMILESDLNSKSPDTRKMRTSIESTKSADPAESVQDSQRRSNTSNVVARESSPDRQVPIQKQNDVVPIRLIPPTRKLPIEDAAILVAMELQRSVPPKSAKAVSNARNEQNKESTR